MLTQGGTNASNSMKLTSTFNQIKTNFTYETERKKSNFWLSCMITFNHFETFPFLLSNLLLHLPGDSFCCKYIWFYTVF